jgi:chromosome segregation ATPase
MSNSAVLLDIENELSKLRDRLDELLDQLDEKERECTVEQRIFESLDSYCNRIEKADRILQDYRRTKAPQIEEVSKKIKSLEERKVQLNKQLFGDFDKDSEDF